MVAPRAAAPLGIGRAGTGIDDLKGNRRSVASAAGLIVGTILVGTHELKAFTAAQIVVVVTWEAGPKLRVVVAIRSREISAQRGVSRVLAEIRVGLAEGWS